MNRNILGKMTVAAAGLSVIPLVLAQSFTVGEPLSATNEAGVHQVMSENVKVFGSFHFTESCTFDP